MLLRRMYMGKCNSFVVQAVAETRKLCKAFLKGYMFMRLIGNALEKTQQQQQHD